MFANEENVKKRWKEYFESEKGTSSIHKKRKRVFNGIKN